jgi:chorismate mutase
MSTSSFMRRAGQAARGVIRLPPRSDDEHGSTRTTNSSFASVATDAELVDLTRRRDQLKARVAELQWDLGGLVYEMAIRDHIRAEVLVRRAAELQNADAELNEVERILRLEQTATAGQCASCGAPHSTGAAYCWQCGQPLLREVQHDAIGIP